MSSAQYNTDTTNNSQQPSYMDSLRDTVRSMTGNTSSKEQSADKVSPLFLPLNPFIDYKGRQPHTNPLLQSDQPSGKYNQTVGAAKQSIGTLVGNENLRRTGEEQNQQGQEQEAMQHLQDWGEGVQNRVKGKVGEVLAAGKPEGGEGHEEDEHMKYKRMHDQGKQAQKGAEQNIEQRWG